MKLIVEGMTCGHCVRSISRSLLELDAAAKVDVNLDTQEVSIVGGIDVAAAVKAIQDEGYLVVAILEASPNPPTAEPAAPSACCGSCQS